MLTYAGVDLIPATKEIEGWVREHFSPASLWLPESHYWAGKSIEHLQTVLPPKARVGTLYWPSLAQRWSYGLFLATGKEMDLINQEVYTNGYLPKVLRMSDGLGTIESLMYLLPARPLSLPSSNLDRLYLLPLVDARYFLWLKETGEMDFTEGSTTWEEVFDYLTTEAGILIDDDDVDPDYLKPSSRVIPSSSPLPLTIDNVAQSVGHRVVSEPVGKLRTLSPSSSLSRLQSNLRLTRDLRAGGEEWYAHIEKNSLVPSTFRASFYEVSGGEVLSSTYTKDITLVSLELPEFQEITGYDGVKLATSTATAASDLSNQTEIDDLAEQTATDWYLYSLASVDAVYEGIVPWSVEGHSGAVEWHISDYDVFTRISRPSLPFEPYGGSASSASPGSASKRTTDEDQAFTGDIVVSGDATFNSTVNFNNNVSFTNVTIDVINSTINFDVDSTVNIYGDFYITNNLIVIDETIWYIDDTTIDVTNSTISFNTNTDITFETSVTITFNSGSDLVLDNLVEVGKNGDATITVDNGTDLIWNSTGKIDIQAGSIEFGSTSVTTTAPSGTLLLPILTASGSPTWSATSSNIVINQANNRVYYYNGSAWDEVGDNLTELDVETNITVGLTTSTTASSVSIIDGGADKPGQLILYTGEADGVPHYFWVDSTGKFRIHTSAPTDEDADGTKFVQTNYINEVTNVIVVDAPSGTRIENNLFVGTNVDVDSNTIHLYGGGANKPGLLALYHAENASKCYVWCDTNGKMRKHDDVPTDEDGDGKKGLFTNLIDEDGPGTSIIIDTPSGSTDLRNIVNVGTSNTTQGEIKALGGGTDNPGLLILYTGESSGVPYYVWADSNGDLRKHTSKPTDEDSDGTVIGGGGAGTGSDTWTNYKVECENGVLVRYSRENTLTLSSGGPSISEGSWTFDTSVGCCSCSFATVSACSEFDDVAQYWLIESPGVSDDTCSDCSDWNSSHTLTHSSSCTWYKEVKDSCYYPGYPAGITLGIGSTNVDLTYSEDIDTIALYRISTASFDPLGKNVLTLQSSDGACSGWPSSITIYPTSAP